MYGYTGTKLPTSKDFRRLVKPRINYSACLVKSNMLRGENITFMPPPTIINYSVGIASQTMLLIGCGVIWRTRTIVLIGYINSRNS